MRLEHVNYTVADAKSAAERLCYYFDWKIRWEGEGKLGGYSVHVGEVDSYVALWQPASGEVEQSRRELNHIGVVVDDLDATEEKVEAMGIKTFSHANYEPGRRFYFNDPSGVEIEVISYQ